ncbi:DgyrCDS1033 [Dimorphilus gyrociliatus]|uniref:DgyrCDS1033 n=1 Tax=Dimorphilus gyrociliatus TaxID=2664684 RepID=A0A7I8V694_9ANNE|nr:DgyrCDS1033 [Dimorphilus gyrociliatus]
MELRRITQKIVLLSFYDDMLRKIVKTRQRSISIVQTNQNPWIMSQKEAEKKFRNQPKSVMDIVRSYANNSTSHGLPKVVRSKTYLASAFWITVCLATVSLFTWQSVGLLRKYKSYPKSVRLEVANQPVVFPAISICNLRPIDVYTFGDVVYHENETFRWSVGEDYDYTGRGESTVSTFERMMIDYGNKYSSYYTYSEIFAQNAKDSNFLWEADRNLFSRMTLAANLNSTAAQQGGIRKEEFIASCEYHGLKCNSSDFSWFLDPAFFNCYTLNISQSGGTILEGPENGLSVILFNPTMSIMNYSNYAASGLAMYNELTLGGEGIRLVIHSINTVPYPLTEGIDIPRGVSANIGIRVQQNERLGPPHGNCTKQDNLRGSSYSYTMASCKKACLQDIVIDRCSCADVSLPFVVKDSIKFCASFDEIPLDCRGKQTIHANYKKCKAYFSKWFERVECMRSTRSNVSQNLSAWQSCECLPPCTNSDYSSYYSLADWPIQETSKTLIDDILKKKNFLKHFPEEKRQKYFSQFLEDPIKISAYKEFIQEKNFLRLNVFISDTTVVKITETDDYNFIQLVSDLGGQLGLWIGVSVVTLMEIIELIYAIFRHIFFKKTKIVNSNVIQVVAKENITNGNNDQKF